MDITLELCDRYIFDYLFATALPLKLPLQDVSHGTGNLSTWDPKSASPWQYEPASQIISFEPSEAAYMSQWPRDNTYRQLISLYLITLIGGATIYFIVSSLSYWLVFDKTTFKHPKFLKNQVKMEITQAVTSMPGIAFLTVPFFWAEIRGYSKLYDTLEQAPSPLYNWIQFPLFLIFTDFCIYFIHRGLHHPLIYKTLHKPHHKWIMPTPYASVAFHPVDGWMQSVPYHLFPFLFPLQKLAYLALFVFVQIWTVMIHDGEYIADSPVLNGAACHTMHHLYFNFNYGQYTTLWDRLCGSYRKPNAELFSRESKMGQKEWERQVKEMETVVKEVEGSDDRSYGQEEELKLSFKKDM